jgi:hypothetical protein
MNKLSPKADYQVMHYVLGSGDRSTAPAIDALQKEWRLTLSELVCLPYMMDDVVMSDSALALATSLMASMMEHGVSAPNPSLDSDGNVLLTWKRASRIQTLIITEDTIKPVITDGGKVTYLGSTKQASLAVLAGLEPLLGEKMASWKTYWPAASRYSSAMKTMSFDKSSCQEWKRAPIDQEASTITPNASPSPNTTESESNR